MQTPDIIALQNEARELLSKVLVNPPTVRWRLFHYEGDFEPVGDRYLSIDGDTFEIIPVKGTRPTIGRTVDVIVWKVLINIDLRTPNDHLASPDVEERDADSFYEALMLVASLWLSDQIYGHLEGPGEPG